MTREEASFILANIDRRVCDDELNEALDIAIKALEQEPKTKVLDKIKAEIIENSIEDYEYHGCGTDELIIETSEVLQIVDKYKADIRGEEV